MVEIVDLSPLIATALWIGIIGLGIWIAIRFGHVVGARSQQITRALADVWSVARNFLAFEHRGRLLLTQLLISIGGFSALFALDLASEQALRSNAGFFQTAAQVQAGVLVALALTQYGDGVATRGVRPVIALAVLLGGLTLLGAVAGTTPVLPEDLHRAAFAVTVSGGATSLLSLVLISWRLLR